MSSEIENAIAANVIVAPATVLSTARALATVEVTPSGRSAPCKSSRLSIQIVTAAPTMLTSTPTIGTKNRLTRIRSTSELRRRRIRPVRPGRHPGAGNFLAGKVFPVASEAEWRWLRLMQNPLEREPAASWRSARSPTRCDVERSSGRHRGVGHLVPRVHRHGLGFRPSQ